MTSIHRLLEPVAVLLELAGVAAILIATIVATATFVRALRRGEAKAYEHIAPTLAAASCSGSNSWSAPTSSPR